MTHDRTNPDDAETLGSAVVDACRGAGFAAAGVASVEPTRWARELRAWLDAGKHGTMAWLERNSEVRGDPGQLLDGARSAVMVADLYHARADGDDPPLAPGEGRVARYARGRDYHDTIKKRLHALCDDLRAQHPGAEFKAFTDTAPVLERELAARAGIGWTGKHTLTIHPRIGSYLLLGGFVTTLELEAPSEQEMVTDHCGTCTRCIDACPTDAITPYSVDARKCISYLTIEHRAPIDEGYHAAMGGWVFGCDICQEVCPHNSAREPEQLSEGGRTRHPAYEPTRDPVDRFDLLEVLGWDAEDRSRELSKSAMKRATLAMWKRNAIIAAGNALAGHELAALRARISAIAADDSEDEIVRDAARAVLAGLGASGG
ncbi:MAG: epoxyqueuosine reductase [Phycisphaeraceae bacterium]|nr:MAG: epoxyqueuosine reductase [Phycisphaeraceae bacterium]